MLCAYFEQTFELLYYLDDRKRVDELCFFLFGCDNFRKVFFKKTETAKLLIVYLWVVSRSYFMLMQ